MNTTAHRSGIGYRRVEVGGALDVVVQVSDDGVIRMNAAEALEPPAARITDRLEFFAARDPGRTLVAKRGADGRWVRISYAEMVEQARRVGQALLDRGLNAERPLVILSGNDLEHFVLAMAAQWIGVPFAPVSPAYSTISQDFAKLKVILQTLTPGLVFAADGVLYERAIEACVPASTEVLVTHNSEALAHREGVVTSFSTLLQTVPKDDEARAHALVGPDTIAKFLFTSGSTKAPKGVINTQRMLCTSQQQILQCFRFMRAEPPVLVDWLPWNHTFGGNHNIGIVVYNGGTLYIDDGKPTATGIAETLRNLREIAPTIYFNVPKGFEEIVRAMRDDHVLRDNLFSRVNAFMFAGAGLSQAVWDELDAHGVAATGQRVCIFTGLGMTEASPSCTFALGADVRSGHIGLPIPGVSAKLVPVDGKLEARFRGPNVMPGYWRAPDESARAFDDEGYYRTGDAVLPIDPEDLGKGLRFDGRIAEDFKLATGTFVNVGPLRARVILAGDPLVLDVVVTGINRDVIGLLVFPRIEDIRRMFDLGPQEPVPQMLADARVRAFFQRLLNRLHDEGTGTASRPQTMIVMAEPPSIDRNEITDKGSINQRAVLVHRADLVDRLYATPVGVEVYRAHSIG